MSIKEQYQKLGVIHSEELCDVCDDLAVTETLYRSTRNRKTREAINKLRYVLIRQMHLIKGYGRE